VRNSWVAVAAIITAGAIGVATWWASHARQDLGANSVPGDSIPSKSMDFPRDNTSVEPQKSENSANDLLVADKPRSLAPSSVKNTKYNLATVGSRTDLKDVFQAALTATDPDTVSSALLVASICFGLPEKPLTKDQLIELHGTSEKMELIAPKVADAHAKISSICKTANAPAFMDELAVALRRTHSAGRYLKMTASLRSTDSDRQPAEYEQAMTVVLGNPMAYTAAFDAWLEKRMPKILPESFTREQTAYVQDLLFEKMLGKVDGDSLRDLNRCHSINICKGAMKLSSAEQANATLVADNIEQSIRQQRWQQLMPKQ
jgi:hypothetical protein